MPATWQLFFDDGHQQRYLPDRQAVLRYVLAVGPKAASKRFEVFRESEPVTLSDGTPGGLFWGTTFLQPGLAGDEYFMTHGHFHAQVHRAEIYATIRGTGALILMSEDGQTWLQDMHPGIGSIDNIDVTPVIQFDVVRLDGRLASLIGARTDTAFIGFLGYCGNVITDFFRLQWVTDVDCAHSCVESITLRRSMNCTFAVQSKETKCVASGTSCF